jgi:hypothetical protein
MMIAKQMSIAILILVGKVSREQREFAIKD